MDAATFQAHYRSLWENNKLHALETQRLANFFEDLGVLESLRSLDIQWIEESLGSVVMAFWKTWELAAIEDRNKEKVRRADAQLIYENWEALAFKIEERRIRAEDHHPKNWWWHRRKHF